MRLFLIFAILIAICVPVPTPAQSTHQAVLTWTAPSDATSATTYNVYRAFGSCPTSGLGTLTFTKINTAAITVLTYTDSGLPLGPVCYYATRVENSIESVPSNTAGGTVRPNTVTIQIVVQ